MSHKILVTYASRTGWTVGVAEAVGRRLAEDGTRVDVAAMGDVTSLAGYDAVVAGSAVRAKAWLPEAVAFLRAHQSELRAKPLAVFSVCMTLAMRNGEAYRPALADWLAPVNELVRPVSTGLFAGGLDIQRVESFGERLKFRISVLLGVWQEGDHRDWQAIEAWAGQLSALLLK